MNDTRYLFSRKPAFSRVRSRCNCCVMRRNTPCSGTPNKSQAYSRRAASNRSVTRPPSSVSILTSAKEASTVNNCGSRSSAAIVTAVMLWRERIRGRFTIGDRPAGVDSRCRADDCKYDTLTSAGQDQSIALLVKRMIFFTLQSKVAHKATDAYGNAAVRLLAPYMERANTLTTDNSSKLTQPANIADGLYAAIWLAIPYLSWNCSTNENTNGLIQQYFPKKPSFDNITNFKQRPLS